MYHEYTQEELRSYCRTNIETLEVWARRLIQEQMVAEYGNDYFDKKINEEYIIKKDIRKHIKFMLEKEPDRFKRPVDTLFIDQIIYFLCNPKWYKQLFKTALDYAYPQGRDEVREFLTRLVPIRNPLSHSNPISVHQAEQAICYSHDFIEGLKQYYKDRGEEQVWNVPSIIRIKDSFGNVFDNHENGIVDYSIFNVSNEIHCYDTYSVEIEVDSSFDQSEYIIKWEFNNHNTVQFVDCTNFSVTFTPADVEQHTYIYCKLITKKEWHKHRTYDDKIVIGLSVLPPM